MIDSTHSSKPRLLAVLLGFALAVAACSGTTTDAGGTDGDADAGNTSEPSATSTASAEEDSDTTEAPTTTAASTEESTSTDLVAGDANVDLSDAAEVTVIDTGAEPRTELRTQVPPGQTEIMVTTQTQEIRQEIGGDEVPSAGAVPMIIETEMSSSSSGGSLLTYDSIITSVELGDSVDPAVAAQIQTNLDAMIGLTTSAIVDDRGRVLTTEIGGTEGLDPTIAATLEQMTSNSQFSHPLPEEAVGVGATWQVTQNLELSGLQVLQITNYEVLSIEGTVVELGLATEQRVPVGSEMLAGGTTATVLSWEATSSGAITYDLTLMVPTSVAQVFAVQEFEFGPGTEKTVLKQTIETTIEISPGS